MTIKRQSLLKSYMRFYSFVAQVVRLGDAGPEKLYSYAAWLIRLLPNRQVPADIEISENMMRLHGHFSRHSPGWSAQLISGICISHKDDFARIERGAALFDDLYAYFREVCR